MQQRRMHPAFVLFLALVLSSCASGGASGASGGSPNRITQEELQDVQSSNVYDAIQRLRPRWLRSRDAREPVRVVVNGSPRGDLDELRRMDVSTVAELRYLDGRQATIQYGMGYGAGAIEVTTR